MGNRYTKMKGSTWPQDTFVLAFKQPGSLLLLHADSKLQQELRRTVAAMWRPGLRSERRLEGAVGQELRLEKDPFDADVASAERLSRVYSFVADLLKWLLDSGCELLASAPFLRGIERSCWLLKRPSQQKLQLTAEDSLAAAAVAASATQVACMAFEDWGQLVFVNLPYSMHQSLYSLVNSIWQPGCSISLSEPTRFVLQLQQQPWDSYKSHSANTPLVLLHMISLLREHGYEYLTDCHVRGNIDSVLFYKHQHHQLKQTAAAAAVLSLSQRDQLRLHNAPTDLQMSVAKFASANWRPGVVVQHNANANANANTNADANTNASANTNANANANANADANANANANTNTNAYSNTNANANTNTNAYANTNANANANANTNANANANSNADADADANANTNANGALAKDTSCFALQLHNSPWFTADWDKDSAYNAREFLQSLLEHISCSGWILLAKADMYRSAYDKSTFVITQTAQPAADTAADKTHYVTVTIHDTNRMSILGATESLKAHLLSELTDCWPRRHSVECFESFSGWTLELSFGGRPWLWHIDNESVCSEGIGLAVAVLQMLIAKGWRLLASADISSSAKFANCSWIFASQL